MEEVVPKRRAAEAKTRDNPEGGELDPTDDARRRCKTNSPSVLYFIGIGGKEKAEAVAAKLGEFTEVETGQGHFL